MKEFHTVNTGINGIRIVSGIPVCFFNCIPEYPAFLKTVYRYIRDGMIIMETLGSTHTVTNIILNEKKILICQYEANPSIFFIEFY